MTIKIRRGLFETNSSSTHALCIAKTNDFVIPKELHFRLSSFGWESGFVKTVEDKASYLYTALYSLNKSNERFKLSKILKKYGVECTFESPETPENEYSFVDHPEDLTEFFTLLFDKEILLLRFLFSKKSFIRTGNDNTEEDNARIFVDEKLVNKDDFEIFIKGN